MRHKKWIAALCCALSFSCSSATAVQMAQAWTTQVLRYSSTGSEVREVQGRLKLLGLFHGKPDGVYGWRTYWAVRDFQYKFGMRVDGVAGEKTKVMLTRATPNYTGPWTGKASTGRPYGFTHNNGNANTQRGAHSGSSASTSVPPVNGISAADIQLLARLVYGEARGEPLKGQVAVCDVILHRIKDPKFPHTVAGVIYQPGAFSAASNGQMDQTPNAEAFKAVHDAITGWDPSHGALYYFNPAKTNNAFVWSRPQIIQIGHHIFTM